MRTIFKRLLWLAVIASIVAQACYVYKFADIRDPTLSSDPAIWGQFGDYLSGTLGTYFSFLAFLGVLITVIIQSDQLDHMRRQSKLEEIQRFLSSTAECIDSILDKEPSMPPEGLIKSEIGKFAVRDFIAAGGHAALQRKFMTPEQQYTADRALQRFKVTLNREAHQLIAELDQLAHALQMFASNQGAPEIAELYRARYQVHVCWMAAMGLLGSSPRARDCFKPEALMDVMSVSPDSE